MFLTIRPGTTAFVFALVFTGIISLSSAAIIIKFLQLQNVDSLIIAAGRLLISLVLLSGIMLVRNRKTTYFNKLDIKDYMVCATAGVFLALHFFSWIESLKYITIAESTALVTTRPVWVVIMSVYFFAEKVHITTLFALLFSAIGLIIMILSDSSLSGPNKHPQGYLLAIGGAAFMGGYLIIGRAMRNRIDILEYMLITLFFSSLIFLFLLFAMGITTKTPTLGIFLLLILLAIGPQLVGHSVIIWTTRKISATFAALITVGEPVGAALLAYLIFAESMTTVKLCAFMLLLLGIFLASLGKKF